MKIFQKHKADIKIYLHVQKRIAQTRIQQTVMNPKTDQNKYLIKLKESINQR